MLDVGRETERDSGVDCPELSFSEISFCTFVTFSRNVFNENIPTNEVKIKSKLKNWVFTYELHINNDVLI